MPEDLTYEIAPDIQSILSQHLFDNSLDAIVMVVKVDAILMVNRERII